MRRQLDLEIHDQLVRYLAKEISLDDFRDWFDAATWDLERAGGSQETWALAGEIELRLSEFSNGHWTEEELQKKLLPELQVYTLRQETWGESDFWRHTSSSSVTLPQDVALRAVDLGSPSDIQASVEYV